MTILIITLAIVLILAVDNCRLRSKLSKTNRIEITRKTETSDLKIAIDYKKVSQDVDKVCEEFDIDAIKAQARKYKTAHS